MRKTIIDVILIGLLSVFAVACGDTGGDQFGEEPGFEQELNEDQDGNGDQGEAGDQEEDDGDVDDDPGIDGPFCGDGFIDGDEECDDGNDQDGDGCSSACEVEAFEGEAEGDVEIEMILDDLATNEAPLVSDCVGTIALKISEGALDGEGLCFLPANVLEYEVFADIDEDGAVEGDIIITLNNRPHAMDVSGSFEDGSLFLEFQSVTLVTARIRALWEGTITADFD